MWVILAPFLEKAALSLALTLLTKLGVVSAVEADGVKLGTHALQTIENLKTEDSYPVQKDKFSAVQS